MSKQATFDPAKRLDLYFRCNRAGSKDFVFAYSDGTPYSFIYQEFTFNIYRNQGERKVLITLPLVYASNTLTASVTKVLSNINEGEYYYELYNTDTEETWLCGDANFHNGKFDGVNSDQNSVTVSINGETIAITLEVTPASGSGGGGSSTWGSITGTLSNQTDLQNALNDKANISSLGSAAFDDSSDFDSAGSAAAAQAASQPLDSDLTAIAGLTPSDGDFLYRESGGWVNKTTSQVRAIVNMTKFLQSAQTNSNAIANTAEDLIGMSFNVVAGRRYKFQFNIAYTSAISTTGSRFTINSSVALTLYYAYYINTLTGTTQTLLFVNASDSPSAANASSNTTGGTCFSTGILIPSSDGVIKMQFASEVAGSGITARQGSWFTIEEN